MRRSDSSTSSTQVGITSCAAGSVKQNPTIRRTAAPSRTTSRPSTVTFPADGRTSPLTSRARVDLPDPLAPMTATRCSVSVERRGREDLALAAAGQRDADGGPASKRISGKDQRRCSSCGKARCTSAAIIATSEVFTRSPIQNGMS